MAFDPIYGINDPLLLALLQGIMKTQNTSQVPQSLVQGAVPQQQFDPTLGLSTSAQYINSSPLDQSLSRGANIQALDTKVGLQTNPEEVYAAAVRNDRPDLAAQAQAAMEWQALQERNNALLQKQQIESAGKVQEEQVKAQGQADIEQVKGYIQNAKTSIEQAGANARNENDKQRAIQTTALSKIGEIMAKSEMDLPSDQKAKAIGEIMAYAQQIGGQQNGEVKKQISEQAVKNHLQDIIDGNVQSTKYGTGFDAAQKEVADTNDPQLSKIGQNYLNSVKDKYAVVNSKKSQTTDKIGGYSVPAPPPPGNLQRFAPIALPQNVKMKIDEELQGYFRSPGAVPVISFLSRIRDQYGYDAATYAANILKPKYLPTGGR